LDEIIASCRDKLRSALDRREPDCIPLDFGSTAVSGIHVTCVAGLYNLPFGTPKQMREEVLRRCEIFARAGGFLFNSMHNVEAGIPDRNIAAMLDAVHEFNGVAYA